MSTLPPHFAESAFGGLLIGAFGSLALWGMSCVQLYHYFSTSSRDGPLFRYSMIVLALVNTTQTFLVAQVVYYYLITQYGNPAAASRIVWTAAIGNMLIEVVIATIRSLYARRIWLISKGNKWLVCLIFFFTLPTLGLSIGLEILLQYLPDLSLVGSGDGIYSTFRTLDYIAFSWGILAELSITASMYFYLFRSKTGFSKTDSIIVILLKFTVSAGVFNLFCSTTSTMLHLTVDREGSNWASMLYWMNGNLYLNAYLVALNSRDRMKELYNGPIVHRMSHLPSTTYDAGMSQTMASTYEKKQDGIVVVQTMETVIEDDSTTSHSGH